MPIAINGSGTITGVSVGGLPDGIVDTDMLAAAAVTGPKKGTGSVLQVVHTSSNTHFTSNSTSFVDVTGMSAAITPSSSSNKILIVCSLAISKLDNHSMLGKIVKDGSDISGAGGVAEGGHGSQLSGVWWTMRGFGHSANLHTAQYMDTAGSTSSITYKVQGRTSASSQNFYINYTLYGENNSYASPSSSGLTLYEIAA
tara:strand:+ start:140 stop:736 length:597 start_codon:yes stop_codon:yes gene_type:complete